MRVREHESGAVCGSDPVAPNSEWRRRCPIEASVKRALITRLHPQGVGNGCWIASLATAHAALTATAPRFPALGGPYQGLSRSAGDVRRA